MQATHVITPRFSAPMHWNGAHASRIGKRLHDALPHLPTVLAVSGFGCSCAVPHCGGAADHCAGICRLAVAASSQQDAGSLVGEALTAMPSTDIRLRYLKLLLCLLVAGAWLAGCKRDAALQPAAHSEPAAAVKQLAVLLHGNDLVGYARSMVSADQYVRLELAWREGRSRWPLSEFPLSGELPALLASLSRANAEQALLKDFDAQLAGQHDGIRQTAQSLGAFGVQYLRSQSGYDPQLRSHYVQWVTALSNWAAAAPLSERKHAQAAIATLTAAVRASGLDGEAALQATGMEESLRRLGPVLAALKSVLDSYGLPLDTSLDRLQTSLIEQHGDNARVHLQYPLGEQLIDTSTGLIRRQGRWYLQRSQDEVAQLLDSPPASAVPHAPAPDADAKSQAGR